MSDELVTKAQQTGARVSFIEDSALLEPYADEPSNSGLLTTPPDQIYAQTLAASRRRSARMPATPYPNR